MENKIVLTSFSLEDIGKAVAEVINSSRQGNDTVVTEIIDRYELCKRLGISEPTAIRYEKQGRIPVIHIGSSCRYNWPKVVAALENTKKGKP